MQLLSRGQPPAREELHTLDASPEPIDRLLTVLSGLVERLDDQAYPLLFPEMQITGGPENAVGVHRLGSLGHEGTFFKTTTTAFRTQLVRTHVHKELEGCINPERGFGLGVKQSGSECVE
jgi:hypothetical protein